MRSYPKAPMHPFSCEEILRMRGSVGNSHRRQVDLVRRVWLPASFVEVQYFCQVSLEHRIIADNGADTEVGISKHCVMDESAH